MGNQPLNVDIKGDNSDNHNDNHNDNQNNLSGIHVPGIQVSDIPVKFTTYSSMNIDTDDANNLGDELNSMYNNSYSENMNFYNMNSDFMLSAIKNIKEDDLNQVKDQLLNSDALKDKMTNIPSMHHLQHMQGFNMDNLLKGVVDMTIDLTKDLQQNPDEFKDFGSVMSKMIQKMTEGDTLKSIFQFNGDVSNNKDNDGSDGFEEYIFERLNGKETSLSLEVIDYFCTIYCKNQNVNFNKGEETINLYNDYCANVEKYGVQVFNAYYGFDENQENEESQENQDNEPKQNDIEIQHLTVEIQEQSDDYKESKESKESSESNESNKSNESSDESSGSDESEDEPESWIRDQTVFFKWAYNAGVIDYISDHKLEIIKDMLKYYEETYENDMENGNFDVTI